MAINSYTRKLGYKPADLTKQLNDARAQKQCADRQLAELEAELARHQSESQLPVKTEHEWCVQKQRDKRCHDQHKGNLQYLKQRWLKQEFYSTDESGKGKQVYNLLLCIENIETLLAEANMLKTCLQYLQCQIGDYDSTMESLCANLDACLCQVELNDELQSQVNRIRNSV